MKRFLSRAPLHSSTRQSLRYVTGLAAKINQPLAENIEINSDILRTLKATKRLGQPSELLVQAACTALIPSSPITRLEHWRDTCREILESARSYPPAVHQVLLEQCSNLVYSHPTHRRALLDEVISGLIESGYPVTSGMYNSYLSAVWNMRQNVHLDQVFEDLEQLQLPLNYDTHEATLLSDTVCTFLALQGDTTGIAHCWDSFATSRHFPGFTDRSFGVVAAAHITRGEFEELAKLQSVLEKCSSVRVGFRFYGSVMSALARTGNIELLETLIRHEKMACVTEYSNHLHFLCLDLIDSENEQFISNLLHFFHGVKFRWGRSLEMLVCDLMSRGAVRAGADLLVHGGDIFNFHTEKQKDIFESETLPDIMSNMTDNLDNILIQLELRGVNTEFTFDFDKISDNILHDIDMLEGEFPQSDWITKLYADKMDKMVPN